MPDMLVGCKLSCVLLIIPAVSSSFPILFPRRGAKFRTEFAVYVCYPKKLMLWH